MSRRGRTGPVVLVAPLALVGGLLLGLRRTPERAVAEAARPAVAVQTPGAASLALTAPRLPATLAAPPAASAPTPENETALMNELRSFKDADPEFAIERARDGNQRFPNSADAPERTSILIHALSAAGRASEARGEAEDMVNRYPDSEWVREIERFTGAHRHRNVHLTPDGKLAFD